MGTATARHRSTETLLVLYDLHSKLFTNVIVDISDKDAHCRLQTKANHIAWLAGSLVHDTYELANAAGITTRQTSHGLFKEHTGIQEGITYPSLTEYKNDWDRITPILRAALLQLSEEQLDSADPYSMPGHDLTFFDAITFIMDRESYCIGQIGLWRRLLGYEAMKYQ